MKWNRWSKLVTDAHTEDTGAVEGGEVEEGRVTTLVNEKAACKL